MLKHSLKAIVVALLVLPALWLLLCGPRGEAQPHPGQVVVSYWEKWTGEEAARMKQIVDDFNRTVGKEKGIFVDFLSMSNVDQKTLVATAAGVPPDVAGLWDGQVAQFASLGALQPLDDFAARRGFTPAMYKPVFWQGCCYQGKLWALVSTPAAIALHYNKRLFYENADKLRAAGCDPTRPPRTIAELDRYAKALDLREGRLIERTGYLPVEPGWYLNLTCYWFGGDLYDPATDRITLTRPENVKAYEWIRGYSLRLGADSMGEFHDMNKAFDSPQNPFLTGKVAMVQQGPWMANYIFNLAPDLCQRLVPWALEPYLPRVLRPFNYDWGVAPFPPDEALVSDGKPREVAATNFDVLVIPQGSKHKEEAFEFIAYVNSQKAMEKLCSLHCKNSVLTAVSAEFIRSHPNPYIDVFERLAASPDAKGVPAMPVWRELADELTVAGQKVYTLKATPREALEYAQARIEARYQRFTASQQARKAAGE